MRSLVASVDRRQNFWLSKHIVRSIKLIFNRNCYYRIRLICIVTKRSMLHLTPPTNCDDPVLLGKDKYHALLRSIAMCHYGQSSYMNISVGVQSKLKSWSSLKLIVKKIAMPYFSTAHRNVYQRIWTYTSGLNWEFMIYGSDRDPIGISIWKI